MTRLFLGRRYYFSAIHTIPQEPLVHGHDYQMDVQITGPIDKKSGLVFSREQLDLVVKRHFLSEIDRTWINNHTLPATGENLVKLAHQKISKNLPQGIQLYAIDLHETRKNSFFSLSQ